MAPMVMRSEGAGRPPFPKAVAGMMVGKPRAAALVVRKRRREKVAGWICMIVVL